MIGRARTISDDVLAVLSAVMTEGPHVRIQQQLDRPLYIKVNEVLEALGGKWNRKEKAHVFADDAVDVLDMALLTGTYDKPADFGFFETPLPLADKLVVEAEIKPGMHCLEPSAGRGNIALIMAGIVGIDRVDTIELQASNCEALKKVGFDPMQTDFLTTQPVPVYDRIVMNPPFAKQQDIAHVQHAFAYLKPGGMLVSVIAAGVAFRRDKKTSEFNELVDRYGYLVDLPDDSFKASGTLVRSVVVILRKDNA